MRQMPKSSFTSFLGKLLPLKIATTSSLLLTRRPLEPEVHPPPANEVVPKSSTQRETRSSTKKRNADQIARGSPDSNSQESSVDAESSSSVQTKGQKKPRKSASANTQASWKTNLQERIKDLERKLKRVTTESVLNARRGAKGTWDQAKIEMEFKILKRDIKSWVKKYGTTRKISTCSEGVKDEILSACDSDCYREVFSEDNFAIIQVLPKGAQLLLEGFLYAHCVYHLIARPFLFVDAVLQEHSRPNTALLSFGNYECMFDEFAQNLAECKYRTPKGKSQ